MGATAAPGGASRPTVGVIVVGNEILTARVRDANTPRILSQLAGVGARVVEVAILPDDPARVAAAVADLAARCDWVITTGGVGPTHDDCTWEAIAAAFGAPLGRHAELAAMAERFLGARLDGGLARLAQLPIGAEIAPGGSAWPLLRFRNVFVLPGVPALVARNLDDVCALLVRDGAAPDPAAVVYLDVDEWRAVDAIDRVVAGHGAVAIGSYPIFDRGDHRLKLTFEAPRRDQVEAAIAALVATVGADHCVRVEWREVPG